MTAAVDLRAFGEHRATITVAAQLEHPDDLARISADIASHVQRQCSYPKSARIELQAIPRDES